MIVNFAEPAHNHNWELDPVIRSLLDTDFHKVLMVQFIAGGPEQDSSPAAESSNGGNDLYRLDLQSAAADPTLLLVMCPRAAGAYAAASWPS